MPLIDQDILLNNTISSDVLRYTPEDIITESKDKPAFMETASAFFKLENPIFNVTKEWFLPAIDREVNQDFDPISKLEKERPDLVDEYVMDFAETVNESEFNRKVFNIDYELEQKNILAKSSNLAVLAAGLMVGVVDPIILIPAVKIIKSGMMASRVLKSVGTGAALGLGAAGISEGILQATQETRTSTESITNVVLQTLMGSMLGAGAGILSKNPAASEFAVALNKALEGEDLKFKISEDGKNIEVDEPFGSSSAGSAEVNPSALYKLGLVGINKKATTVLNLHESLKAPDLRAAESESLTLNRLGSLFYNSNYIRKGHLEGFSTGSNAQNRIYQRDNLAAEKVNEVDKLYLQYTGVGQIKSSFEKLRPEGKISSREFSRRMYTAIVSNDYTDPIPEVNKAAKLMHDDMQSTVKELQELNLLSEELDPEFMQKYMTRIYDLDKLVIPKNRKDLEEIFAGYIKEYLKDGTKRKIPLKPLRAIKKAEKVVSKILGESEQQIALQGLMEGVISKGKFLKKREMLIGDDELQDFLVDDAVMLYQNYMRKTARLIETQRALNSFRPLVPHKKVFKKEPKIIGENKTGATIQDLISKIEKTPKEGKEDVYNVTIGDIISLIKQESKKAVEKEQSIHKFIKKEETFVSPEDIEERIAEAHLGPKQLKKANYYKKQEQLAKNMYRSMLGQLAKPGEGSRAVKEILYFQYMTKMGGVLITSIAEPFMFLYRAGFIRTFKDFIIPAITNFKETKLSRQRLRDLSGSIDVEMSKILRSMAGIDDLDEIGRNKTNYETGRDIAAEVFTKATGIVHWTYGERRIASQLASADIIRTILKGPKGKDIQRMATLGIDKTKYKMFKELFETEGNVSKHAGTYIPNREAWNNPEALEIFNSAVINEIESMVLKPSIESLPFVVQKHGIGRILFQYKSFMNAATHRITISGIQRRDAAVLQGLIGLTIGGMMSELIYRQIKADDSEINLDELILAGISRSGWLGLVGTAVLDFGSVLANKNRRRYADRTLEGLLLGPSVGTIVSAGSILSRIMNGNLDKKTFKSLSKFIPFNNLFYLRVLTERYFKD